MSKILFLVFLTTFTIVKSSVIIEDANHKPCFQGTLEERDNYIYRPFEQANELADQFFKAEGTAQSKYELYKSTCKEIHAKVLSAKNPKDLLICEGDNADNYEKEVYNKTEVIENYFGAMCNLNEVEYAGFIYRTTHQKDVKMTIRKCFKIILVENASIGDYHDYCSPRLPELVTCFKTELGENNYSIEFLNAQFAAMKKIVCNQGFTVEEYLRKFFDTSAYFDRYDYIMNHMGLPVKH